MTEQMPRTYPERWRLSRAGMINIWHYQENTFDLSGGRMILRGTNGSGKSRALEMLLPFLLDADRRKMDATGSGRVTLDDLMHAGAEDQNNRTGYLWLELRGGDEWLTVGALVRHGLSSRKTDVWYFMTPLRVGPELPLIGPHREPLSREGLIKLIGADAITDSPERHRERIRSEVFALHGDSGRDRYAGLLQLLHTLRAPDVGNRIEEGRLPQILSDALPPLAEQALTQAGEKLDGLTVLRETQQQQEADSEHIRKFLATYRRYAATTVCDLADETSEAAQRVARSEQAAAEAVEEADRLEAATASKEAELTTRQDRHEALVTAVDALKSRDIFKRADDLKQRDNSVAEREEAADFAYAEADRERAQHTTRVAEADEALEELAESAESAGRRLEAIRAAAEHARIPVGKLPEHIRVERRRPEMRTEAVRLRRDREPEPYSRPVATEAVLSPEEPSAVREDGTSTRQAAVRRGQQAAHRRDEARRLDQEGQRVHRLDDMAGVAQQHAEHEAERAAAESERRDDLAVELVGAWRSWTEAAETAEALGRIDWPADPQVAPVLIDLNALTGDPDPSSSDIASAAAAEQAAGLAVQHAREALVRETLGLDAETGADEELRRGLQQEAAKLRKAEDPAPATPPWLAADRPGTPLWRTVDFTDSLSDTDRAGVEGALLAAGLLTATLHPDGTLRADDGTALLSPGRPVQQRSLTEVLHPDPAVELDADLITGILDGIGVVDDVAVAGEATVVDLHGGWRHGPLRGRHQPESARHIGAAARARARQQRLEEIDAEIADLDRRAEVRAERLAALAARESRIETVRAAIPRSIELNQARATARLAAERAEEAAVAADAAQREASAIRNRWAAELQTHADVCAAHDLPSTADGLTEVVTGAGDVQRGCSELDQELERLVRRRDHHAASLIKVDEAEQSCRDAERRTESTRDRWWRLSIEVAALHDAVDLEVEQANAELKKRERQRDQEKARVHDLETEVRRLSEQTATARERAHQAAAVVDATRNEMAAAARVFSARLATPGLMAALSGGPVPVIDDPTSIDAVRQAVRTVTATVKRPSQPADANSVLRGFQTFERDVAGHLEVLLEESDDVKVIIVHGAGDETTLAGAAATITERVAAGRAALTEREREVFTTFVLGGVAEELRRKINQATSLIKAMNDSLGSISTSNGIGVRLRWGLNNDDPDLHRIAELVRTADAVRTAAQNDELTELLRRRVDAAYQRDSSSGYATHLATALDYRDWHAVEVTILGPAPGQTRRLSGRAKLSQGETRFVSYVSLFAAADGYLTGLSNEGHQLRLILLDDAFAKVDDPTIADLMGLLVRLDLDFVMTGYGLWGCYPQVPKLDVYEVRRHEGTAAITTHFHWDGRQRHLRTV